jgi:hypothetical protein
MKKFISLALALMLMLSFVACGGGGAHSGEAQMPGAPSTLQGKDYQDVVIQLETAGFTNIETEALGDLITGWLHDDGEVKEISVNGETDFSSSSWYPTNAKIVIRYHSYPEPTEDAPSATEKPPAANTPPVAETPLAIANYIGRDAVEARDELISQGYKVTLLFETTGQDYTSEVDYSNDENHYIITKQDKPSGNSITLYINSQEQISAANNKDTQKSNLESKLDPSVAWGTCTLYGESQYPYGFKIQIATGMLAEEPYDDNTWFLKATCVVTNAYGTKQNATVECRVSGTTANPVVDYFVVY